MLSTNVLVRKALRFFGGIGEHTLALVAQRQVNRGRNLFANRGVAFDLFADRFDGSMRTQKTIRQSLIFAQQPEQEVLGLNVRRTELACLIPGEENDSPGLLRIAFEHKPISP